MFVERFNDNNFGELGVVEFSSLPFLPRRMYWITNFVKGNSRGNHAHKSLTQFMTVPFGSVKFELIEGENRKIVELKADNESLLIPPGIWRTFSSDVPGTVLLVLCDQGYAEDDYIRNWDEYLDWYSKNHER